MSVFLLLVSPQKQAVADQQSSTGPNGYQQTANVVLPIVKRDSLLNGLQLVLLENAGTGSVSVRLRINSGAMFDLAGKGGLADLTAGMLLRGGGGNDAKAISDLVEQLGLTVHILVDWDSTDIMINGPADSLEAIFELLGKLVIKPAFDQKEFEELKSMKVAELKSAETEDADRVRRKALDLVFGTHPFGRPMHGTTETLPNIKQADLQFFHNRYYLANNSELIVSGDATIEKVTQFGRSKLGAWKKGEKVPATFQPPSNRSRRDFIILDRAGTARTYAAIAQIGFSRRADDYFASAVMVEILKELAAKAAGSNDSRVTVESYARFLPGPILVEIEASPEEMPATIDRVLSLMKRMQTVAVSVEEIEAAKERVITSFKEKLRTSEGAADVLLDVDLYGLGRDYLINYISRVSALTPLDVQKAASAHLTPETAGVAVSGPAGKIEGALKDKGTVTVMP